MPQYRTNETFIYRHYEPSTTTANWHAFLHSLTAFAHDGYLDQRSTNQANERENMTRDSSPLDQVFLKERCTILLYTYMSLYGHLGGREWFYQSFALRFLREEKHPSILHTFLLELFVLPSLYCTMCKSCSPFPSFRITLWMCSTGTPEYSAFYPAIIDVSSISCTRESLWSTFGIFL